MGDALFCIHCHCKAHQGLRNSRSMRYSPGRSQSTWDMLGTLLGIQNYEECKEGMKHNRAGNPPGWLQTISDVRSIFPALVSLDVSSR